MNNLKDHYLKIVVPKLTEEFEYENIQLRVTEPRQILSSS
jgi:hypothetical protein